MELPQETVDELRATARNLRLRSFAPFATSVFKPVRTGPGSSG
jgi:hypothetical protein